MAYQLDLPEQGEGLVVVLKRPGSGDTERALYPSSINPAASYQITNLDSGQQETIAGSVLSDKGLRVQLRKQPDSAVLHYKAGK